MGGWLGWSSKWLEASAVIYFFVSYVGWAMPTTAETRLESGLFSEWGRWTNLGVQAAKAVAGLMVASAKVEEGPRTSLNKPAPSRP